MIWLQGYSYIHQPLMQLVDYIYKGVLQQQYG